MINKKCFAVQSKTFNLSYEQKSLYFIQQLNPSNTSYNVGLSFKCFNKFEEKVFRETIIMLLANHKMLNAAFKFDEGKIQQYIKDQLEYDLFITDVSGWDETTLTKKVNLDFHTCYDLLSDNMLRVYLYRNDDYDLVTFVIHHIIADFASVEILLNDFIKIYQELNHQIELSPINKAIMYDEFVIDEESYIISEKFKSKISYWENVLQNLDEGIDFNLDTSQAIDTVTKGDRVVFEFGLKERDSIIHFCNQYHITPFIFFLTIYKLLLFQIFGKRDVVIGVPVSLRRNLKFKQVIGNFINLLPIRMKTDGKTFVEDAKAVNAIFVEAMLNKKVPYSLLVERVNPSRDKKNPIFQTTFNYLAKRFNENELNMDQNNTTRQKVYDYEIEAFPIEQQLDQMDISLEFIEYEQVFSGVFKYNKEIFNKEIINDYANRYKSLVHRILDDSQSSVECLKYESDKEKQDLIYVTGRNQKTFPKSDNVLEMIQQVALEHPERIAAKDETSKLTYQRLMNKVNSFARYLKSTGVEKGDSIIVYMNKQVEVLIALLAIMKVGGVYVPVDTSFPKSRVLYILECAASPRIVTTLDLQKEQEFLEEAICIDTILKSTIMANQENFHVEVKPEDSAYIIFTSGSTGKPKGVEIQHKALVNFLYSMADILELKMKEEINIGGVTSISFDISILEFLLPLITGGQTILLTKKVVTDANLFDNCIKNMGINIFQATPTTWKMILELGWIGNQSMDVLVGGEMVTKDLAFQLTSNFNNVWNVYGPTEATIWATTKKLSVKDEVVSVGLPLHNMEAYILDGDYQIVQKKVVGKLYLAGVGLAKGYYKREELTRERFVDIVLDGEQKRIYDTGDLAKYLKNGEIQVVGRDDDQIKLSGYRIELGEIESVLKKFEGIKNAAVLIKDNRLKAYIITSIENQKDLLKELRAFCKRELTSYMMPSEYIMVDEIPLTPNQKIDRKALSTIQGKRLIDSTVEVVITKGAYLEMISIWKDVLGNYEIGMDDNFFDIGGTSLLAMILQQRIKNNLGDQLTILDIFTYPTVRTLCDFMNDKEKQEQPIMDQTEIKRGKQKLANMRKRRSNG